MASLMAARAANSTNGSPLAEAASRSHCTTVSICLSVSSGPQASMILARARHWQPASSVSLNQERIFLSSVPVMS